MIWRCVQRFLACFFFILLVQWFNVVVEHFVLRCAFFNYCFGNQCLNVDSICIVINWLWLIQVGTQFFFKLARLGRIFLINKDGACGISTILANLGIVSRMKAKLLDYLFNCRVEDCRFPLLRRSCVGNLGFVTWSFWVTGGSMGFFSRIHLLFILMDRLKCWSKRRLFWIGKLMCRWFLGIYAKRI